MSAWNEEAKPYPKSRQLARGVRRYRRKVASAKQWARIASEKSGPCRICDDPASNGRMHSLIQLHHVVSQSDGGDDVEDNIVPLCVDCHNQVTLRRVIWTMALVESLTGREYRYMLARGGPDYARRAYGVEYER